MTIAPFTLRIRGRVHEFQTRDSLDSFLRQHHGGVLPDGASLGVPNLMMDAGQITMADTATQNTFADARDREQAAYDASVWDLNKGRHHERTPTAFYQRDRHTLTDAERATGRAAELAALERATASLNNWRDGK